MKTQVDWYKVGAFTRWTLGVLFALTVLGALIFWIFWVGKVEQYEVGYKWDRRTGEVTVLPRTGYFINPPFLVEVHGIDTRPQQVCINANQRVLNCKLVQFRQDGLNQFIEWHGLQDGDVSEILKSYAYDGQNKSYPFLLIKTELGAQPAGEVQ